jgi:hypothetical protein
MKTKRYAAVLRRDDKTLFIGVDAENMSEALQTLGSFNLQSDSVSLLKDMTKPKPDTAKPKVVPPEPKVAQIESVKSHVVRRAKSPSGESEGPSHLVKTRGYTACDIDVSRGNWNYIGYAGTNPVTCPQCRKAVEPGEIPLTCHGQLLEIHRQ